MYILTRHTLDLYNTTKHFASIVGIRRASNLGNISFTLHPSSLYGSSRKGNGVPGTYIYDLYNRGDKSPYCKTFKCLLKRIISEHGSYDFPLCFAHEFLMMFEIYL